MKPETTSHRHRERSKLLLVPTELPLSHAHVGDLPQILRRDDLLIVNRSGTLPSSFHGHFKGEEVEIRLASFMGSDLRNLHDWKAISFGKGDWRVPTENRAPPPVLKAGDRVFIARDLEIEVTKVDVHFPRLLEIKLVSFGKGISPIYAHGRPIQYSYHGQPLQVWDQQTLFAGPPLSVEPPSAAFPFTWSLIESLRKKGIQIADLIHGAGLSSTGQQELDEQLPLDEFFQIPDSTLRLVSETKNRGGRIVALGTTVARALESALEDVNHPKPEGRTSLRLGPSRRVRVVDVLLTGMHEAGTSHSKLMQAFREPTEDILTQIASQTAAYRSHEYGDMILLERSLKRPEEEILQSSE